MNSMHYKRKLHIKNIWGSEENGASFEENVRIKASVIAKRENAFAIATDGEFRSLLWGKNGMHF